MFRGQKGDQYTGSPEAGSAPDKRTGKSKKEAGSLPVLPPKIDRQKKSSKKSAAESSDLATDLADLNSDLADLWGSVGHLVLSLEAGARAQRELMRSLWAGEVARRRRLVFVVAHSDESDEDLRRESEEHDDLLSVRPPTPEHLPQLLTLAALHFSLTQWPLASFTLLTSDSVLVSPEAVSRLASRHSVSSSRVLGSLYKRHAPARHTGATHHIREELGTRLCVQ